MRQFFQHGLSGFLLDQKIRQRDEDKLSKQTNDVEIAKAALRKRVADAAEFIWTYIAYVSINENFTVEAKMEAFLKLCQQVGVPRKELNYLLQSR